jgi:hypothetical protein
MVVHAMLAAATIVGVTIYLLWPVIGYNDD